MKREVCELMITISQGVVWYKVLVVGKDGKFYDMIEVSALWSTLAIVVERWDLAFLVK